jgi:DNA topoisomerase-1
VRDRARLRQLEAVGVPATWTEVRLSLNPRSHIQAAGYDGSGKLQYLYHEKFLEYRNTVKFGELPVFGAALPRMRRRITRDLHGEGWSEDRLMALLVRILDRYHLRVGSRVYATRNSTFGLTTLRKKHLKENGTDLTFDYVAKGGKRSTVLLTDPDLVALVREVAEFPGWELFSIDAGGERITADAQRINDYIRRISGEDFTARTFRTWAGTVLCVKCIDSARREVRRNPQRQLAAALTERVAGQLGNTPAICRQYYMHPDVLEAVLRDGFDPSPGKRVFPGQALYRVHERRTMEILSGDDS